MDNRRVPSDEFELAFFNGKPSPGDRDYTEKHQRLIRDSPRHRGLHEVRIFGR
jgi:hypothetical protein